MGTEIRVVVWVSLELVLCVDSFLCAEVFESVDDMCHGMLPVHLVVTCAHVHRRVVALLLANNCSRT